MLTTIATYFCEPLLHFLPVFYFLKYQVEVIVFFNNLKQLYYNPQLARNVRLEKWIRKCFKFSLLYEVVHTINLTAYGLVSEDFKLDMMLVYLPLDFIITLSKGTMLLIMYGAGQYLLTVAKAFNEVVLSSSIDKPQLRSSDLMKLYNHLWKCCECFNALFGIPIVCYLLMVCLRPISVFYMLSSIFLLGGKQFTIIDFAYWAMDISCVLWEILSIMLIIGTCCQIKDEYQVDVIVFFNDLKQLYYNPQLARNVQLDRWIRKCFKFSLLYEVVNAINLAVYGFLSEDFPLDMMLVYATLFLFITLSKGIVLLIMYGAGQYLLMVAKTFNVLVVTSTKDIPRSRSGELIDLYNHLWKCCECFNALFAVAIICYLLMACLRAVSVLYLRSSILLHAETAFTIAGFAYWASDAYWALWEILSIMLIIGTCCQIKNELLYIKAVLLGVVPFRCHLYPVALELKQVLLCYCYLVSSIGQASLMLINLSWSWNFVTKCNVLHLTAIAAYLCESLLLALPVFSVLLRRAELITLFHDLKQLYYSPPLAGRIRLEKWISKCFKFNSLYEIMYTLTMVAYGFCSDDYSPEMMLAYVPAAFMTAFSKATVLLIVYGVGQYLLIVTETFNETLVAGGFTTSRRKQQLYDQLWKCCECFNAIFGFPITCYLLLVCLHSITILYTLLSMSLLAEEMVTLADFAFWVEEIVRAIFDVLYVMEIVGTCKRVRQELYPATLESRTILLYYCYFVTIVGQNARLLLNLVWAWNYSPVLYILSYRKEVIVFFNCLKQLYYSFLLTGCVRLEKWLWKCIRFNLLYDIVCISTLLVYGFLSSNFPPNTMVAYVLCMCLTTFSKGIVLLIMYGAGQYLLTVLKAMKNVLLSGEQTSTQRGWNEFMLLYDQLWKCCECFKALFGIPIMCYLMLVVLHSTVVLYTLSSMFLLGKVNLTLVEIVLSLEELFWVFYDLLNVSVIVGTCSQIKDELYYSPLIIGRIRLEKWLWKCIHFNLLYDIMYFTTMMIYGVLSSDFPPNTMVAYVLCMHLTTFSKGIVLLIMYGVGQYLLTVWKSMNAVLLPSGQTSTQYGWNEFMLLYDQLWKCCECFKVLFGIPIMCYLLLEFIHSTVLLYSLASIFLFGKENLTPIEIVLAVEELSWAVFDLLYVMVIIGTCSQIKDELYPATLKSRPVLLCYCFIVTIVGQDARLFMNFVWAWNYAPEYFILRATSIFNYSLESVVLALPVFYVLSYRKKVILFFNCLTQLYYCPLVIGCIRLEKWLWKCIWFSLLYDIVYISTMVVYGVLSSDFPPEVMVAYVPFMCFTTLSKVIVLSIMYGAGQYLLIVWKSMNAVLLSDGQTSTQCVWNECMLLYDQLWRCCECFNTLFGIPILCYLFLVFLHSTVVLYTMSSMFLLGKANLSLTEIVLSVEELFWAVLDLLYIMVIVGTCSWIKDEVLLQLLKGFVALCPFENLPVKGIT
ncbi:hypothetical protein ZHAS_00017714 [Anopheles sinensis]|uniref:Uncharacterized protein n=1 Tax=Anopheles sinensis TaxID=74873 RepID=A0A084WH17_ANOSI|nr:hypothetical protein ZHAS_00017714 [Anopheles sinensis]